MDPLSPSRVSPAEREHKPHHPRFMDGVHVGNCRIAPPLSNAVQRVLSAVVLAPLITYFLWRSPVFATTTVTAVVFSIACYEYAWLAHRIHERWMQVITTFDARLVATVSPTESISHSLPDEERCSTTSVEDEDLVAFAGQRCAISGLADRLGYFRGCHYVATCAVVTVGTALSVLLFVHVASLPSFTHASFGGHKRYYYAVICSIAEWVCACWSPTWQAAVLLIVENEIFKVLTLYSVRCPINNFQCEDGVNPAIFLRLGMLFIIVFRLWTTYGPSSSSSSPTQSAAAWLLHACLDCLGYIYIIGPLFFIVSFVDLDREETYRKLVVVMLYVTWASDSGAYLAGHVLDAVGYTNSHPLARHLSARKDYEGTFVAILFGVGAMFVSSRLLDVEGSILEKLLFAAIAVIVGRVGDLFESLLKRTARVKDSGRLIPGHGGVLDRIDALMFAAIVFSRYFGAIAASKQP